MASGTLTITGKIGAGITVTSLVLTNVSKIEFDLAANVIRVFQSSLNKITEFDYAVEATVTWTISGTTATITIST